jgi:hypothetical protein
MSFAADQSARMFPEPMNAAEIQLALQKLNVLGRVLYVAANLRCAAIRSPVIRRAKRNQQRNRLREVFQPLTRRCDSRLRRGGGVAAAVLQRSTIAAIVNIARITSPVHYHFLIAVRRSKEAQCAA